MTSPLATRKRREVSNVRFRDKIFPIDVSSSEKLILPIMDVRFHSGAVRYTAGIGGLVAVSKKSDHVFVKGRPEVPLYQLRSRMSICVGPAPEGGYSTGPESRPVVSLRSYWREKRVKLGCAPPGGGKGIVRKASRTSSLLGAEEFVLLMPPPLAVALAPVALCGGRSV